MGRNADFRPVRNEEPPHCAQSPARIARVDETDPKPGEIASLARRQFKPVRERHPGDLEVSQFVGNLMSARFLGSGFDKPSGRGFGGGFVKRIDPSAKAREGARKGFFQGILAPIG